jgi:hypothetical protein
VVERRYNVEKYYVNMHVKQFVEDIEVCVDKDESLKIIYNDIKESFYLKLIMKSSVFLSFNNDDRILEIQSKVFSRKFQSIVHQHTTQRRMKKPQRRKKRWFFKLELIHGW